MQGEANPQTAKYDIAYSKFQQEQYAQAASYFEQVVKNISPASSTLEHDAYIRTADAYFMQRDFAKAGSMYASAIQAASPQSDYALYQQAMIAGIKNSAEKIRILSTVNKQYPNSNLRQDINMEIALTYISDEKFADAVPYLNAILTSNEGGLKPRAYQKLGLAYYNSNNNAEALKNYSLLLKNYPQSPEADDALSSIKNIYVEDGKPDEYIAFMKQIGKPVSMNEADSLSWTAAVAKYDAGNCALAITSFTDYLSKYPGGSYTTDANFLRSDCYEKSKDFANAIKGYDYVNAKGNSKYFERATLQAARISYFELKDYAAAKKYFESLRQNAVNLDNQLEALRGLVRTYYQTKDYTNANTVSKELLTKKGITTDDKAIASLVLGKSQQVAGDCAAAISSFKTVSAVNRSAWGAEARYETANCLFTQTNYAAAEKTALSVIKETGSYDEWVTRAYILLGDLFMQKKDYFNAKATYESIYQNAAIPELKAEAKTKLDKAVAEEKSQSKISN